MKTSFIILALLISSVAALQAQTATTTGSGQTTAPAPTPYRVVKSGPNHNVWQRETYEQAPGGTIVTQVDQYIELGTGLNHLENSQFVPSSEEIDILPDGTAAATNGQQQAYFPGDIYEGAVRLVTPEGKTLVSQPIGLSYDDGDKTVLIAAVTNSTGQLIGNNQAIYKNAFSGIKADVLYTYRKGGFEQDIVLRQQPPTPESLGLNPATARLQVLTEFFNPPPPTVTTASLSEQAGVPLLDQALDFGVMKMMPGRAFLIGTNSETGVRVFKQWLNVNGRTILVEEVPFNAVAGDVSTLPLTARAGGGSSRYLASVRRQLPPQRLAKADSGRFHPMKMARAEVPSDGLVLDYDIINSSQTNYVFQADTTYYISAGTYLHLYGTTTIEGGAVIKYGTTNFTDLEIMGPLNCETAPYRPAIFTTKDDNSIGDTITGSTGNPVTLTNQSAALDYYAYYYTNSGPLAAHDLHMNYMYGGITENNYGTNSFTNEVKDCQFNSVYEPVIVHGGSVTNICLSARNILVWNAHYGFLAYDAATLSGENITFHHVNTLFEEAGGGTESLALTNCLFIAVTNWGSSFTGCDCATNASDAGVFQVVGGGSHYLATNSIYRGEGTTNIDPGLLADLQTKTTWPPVVYTDTNISSLQSLGPDVPRDTNALPDLGYHYDPLDYVFGGGDLYSNLTFTAGTAVGWFEAFGGVNISGQPYGISLNNGANLMFAGTVTDPCKCLRFDGVQEAVNGNWETYGYMSGFVFNGSGTSPLPQLAAQFTDFFGDFRYPLLRDNWDYGRLEAANCEFYETGLASYAPSFYFTNCLFFRIWIHFPDQTAAASFTFQNCTYYNGFLNFGRSSGQSASFWRVEDTAFDGTGFEWADNHNGNTNYTDFDYNSYNTNNLSWETYPYPYPPNYGSLETESPGPHDVHVDGYDWQESWFGDFYLPPDSPLIDVGSTTADQVGLYHFTTQTNQVPETNSVVDIGYHYVATDAYGNPLDSNSDGIPDYLEDANGNGIFDAGDLGEWQISPYGLSADNALEVFTPLK